MMSVERLTCGFQEAERLKYRAKAEASIFSLYRLQSTISMMQLLIHVIYIWYNLSSYLFVIGLWGKIFRLGCLSSLNVEESLDCKTALSLSKRNATCIDTGSRRVCCCSPAMQCNSIWKPFLHLPHLNTEEFATIEWGFDLAGNGYDRLISIELSIGIIKVMIIFILLLSAWYPILPECQDHDEGVFEEKYYFIPQSMRSFVCHRAHTFVSTSATVFSIASVLLFALHGIELYRHEMSSRYCKLGRQFLRLAFCILLYILYAVIAIIQEVTPFFLTRKIDTSVDSVAISEKIMLNESFGEQLETAKSDTVVNGDDCLRVTPTPFILDSFGEGVLSLENLQPNEWITLRFSVGRTCPCVDVTRLWERPYIFPRSRWKFYVLPVYHESQDASDHEIMEDQRDLSKEHKNN
ncbi:hypothetical protein DICVIV_02884 [Dictyocaulus viviparus]|uniref:Uncharacterized protein n=1 Tax=Dictyocaulus viviparus TaxID=29172 RepID=A0A0D8Y236_DICVI|nr:hypothetical protein DICVIV_02884 [Dictyocaulus viviparus]